MIDTHAIARTLTNAKLTPEQVNATTGAVRQAADHGDYVTRGELRAELAALELRLVKWIVGSAIAGAGIVVAAVIAALRLLGG